VKPETRFRTNYVLPFLKTLKMTARFPIQQLTMVGDPDLMLCIRGKFVAMELKAEGGRVSALQEYKLNEVRRCGGLALIVDPHNWESTKQTLVRMDGGLK
jgi:hypothetical protein